MSGTRLRGRLVFLVATERSGGTLLAAMLRSHSRIWAPPPTHLFSTLLQGFGSGPLGQNAESFSRAANALLGFFPGHGLEPLRQPDGVTAPSEVLRGWVQGQIGDFDVASIKDQGIADDLPHINSVFPEACFVFLTRSPLEVAASWKASPVHRGGVRRSIGRWISDQENMFRFRQTRPEKCIAIEYTQLCKDPRGVLGEVCEFVGIGYEPEMLRFHHNQGNIALAALAAPWRNIVSPLRQTSDVRRSTTSTLNSLEVDWVIRQTEDLVGRIGLDCLNQFDRSCSVAGGDLPPDVEEKPGFAELSLREQSWHLARSQVLTDLRERRQCRSHEQVGR